MSAPNTHKKYARSRFPGFVRRYPHTNTWVAEQLLDVGKANDGGKYK